MKIIKLILSLKLTLKSIAQNFQTFTAKMILYYNSFHLYLEQVFLNPAYCSDYSLMILMKIAFLIAPCRKLKAFEGFLKVFLHLQLK